MKISQSNYLNMASAVVTLFDGKPSVWNTVPVLIDGVERIRKNVTAIRDAAIKQGENKPAGHFNARRIHDIRGRKTKPAANEEETV